MTPSDRQFRAPLVTRKPEIVGYQSALVIKDKGGPEIDVDKDGRILVQFYWDRKKKPSRRVRVAQFWAGSNRGALFVPRVGDEVLITYEEGDPDRPIVIGSVYNGTNTVPTTLPDKKTQSGILTQSSTGGDGYNMLMFDDTAGTETRQAALAEGPDVQGAQQRAARHPEEPDREYRPGRDDQCRLSGRQRQFHPQRLSVP